MDAARLDPRAGLVAPVFDHRAFHSRPKSTFIDASKRASVISIPPANYPKRKPCYDWIFSSASNVHVAIDRSAFKTYIPFRTYVLAIADQRQVPAKGIGTVEIKIKRQPGSKDSNKVVLENVLHIPSWLCNIVSDVYMPVQDFEHNWSEFGINFQQRKDGKWKPWGYTEGFCGLERLVLYKDMQGRSPMLEDKDREVFSVNVSWPQHQRTKWTMMIEEEERRVVKELERGLKAREEAEKAKKDDKTDQPPEAWQSTSAEEEKVTNNETQEKVTKVPAVVDNVDTDAAVAPVPVKDARSSLVDVDPNLKVKRSFRTNSLRVPGKSAFREALPWRKSVEQ